MDWPSGEDHNAPLSLAPQRISTVRQGTSTNLAEGRSRLVEA